MNMNYFVSGSSLLIAAWLVVTFFHEVSPQEYPKQRRGGLPAQTAKAPAVRPAPGSLKGISSTAADLAASQPGH
jgi:hypothetical protein